MSNITRFDPFTGLTRLDPFGDFDDMVKGFVMRPVFQGVTAAPQMKLDVTEDDKAYTVKAEIPGVKKEDIHISVDGNLVSISAEVKKETEKKEGKKVVHSERYFGQVSRSFTLDKDVEQGAATANYTDGVLEAVLPKKKGAAATQIAVS